MLGAGRSIILVLIIFSQKCYSQASLELTEKLNSSLYYMLNHMRIWIVLPMTCNFYETLQLKYVKIMSKIISKLHSIYQCIKLYIELCLSSYNVHFQLFF